MADYHLGLDFGTSQTKVCLLNKDSDVREFIKFDNDNYFLPSLIVKKADNTFSYGNEDENGIKYRYFKMAAAEDDELIQITNEDLHGNLENGTIDDFRKYSTDYQIKPEILVILYLTYTYLFIKQQKSTQSKQNVVGLLGKLAGKTSTTQNTFSINLGIPTEWNNPNHIKRKIKFQSLLIASIELANQFDNLEAFLNAKETDLFAKISKINENHLSELIGKVENERADLIKEWLIKYKLSVFPESAAGVNYLLKTRRLANGSYATLDIGAGTSDIAMFQVNNNNLTRYYCSESISLASNDVYREYPKQLHNKEIVTFDEIKKTENIIRNSDNINDDFYNNARRSTKGFLNRKGIEFVIGKTLYRQYYLPFRNVNTQVQNIFNELNNNPIIIFGGGANLKGFCEGNYGFYQGNNPYGYHDRNFIATPITNYINQVDIVDEDKVQNHINLLVVALGLTYGEQNDNYIPFIVPQTDFQEKETTENNDRYFYYDLQDAAYK
ncbi:hypothetical protein [Runella sp.]|uniref:hypothetical protein n=1 Tax=Runella sp. TaxID=1960881 RepID=UPI0030197851